MVGVARHSRGFSVVAEGVNLCQGLTRFSVRHRPVSLNVVHSKMPWFVALSVAFLRCIEFFIFSHRRCAPRRSLLEG